ncbi:hypothetical protein JTE90_014979 [Oedothorax gibbosus]|uniref:CS domain-containing protein n=1 Tax=Oedothorax gibbosus TaxID=931172 RepID=A0AAV6UYI0_9ARAC|nr:hypothetical protein JTE90_014979 [Oedothorax gibbosus]
MSSNKNYDDFLFPILCNEETIYGFFDQIFEFLYRKTDFFKLKGVDSEDFGLESGEAEKIVRSIFCKYMQEAANERRNVHPCETENIPLDCVSEETVVTTSETEDGVSLEEPALDESESSSEVREDKPTEQPIAPLMEPDSYNGASYDGYCWSQSIKDLDVRFKVPKDLTSGKQVRVEISQSSLKVYHLCGEDWSTLKEGEFAWPIHVEESTWTLVPNEHIHVYVSKLKERWWGRLFLGEREIDLKRIDSSVPYEELDPDSQAKIQELLSKEHIKRTGGTHNTEMESILKDAWDQEGSPFKGQPFDPSIINMQDMSIQKRDVTSPF